MPSEKRKICVTGGLGYLGSVLSPVLLREGYDCVVYDTGFFREALLYPPKEAPYRLIDVRLLREEDFDGIDVVVHLAGISNDPFGDLDPEKIYDPTRHYALDIAKKCKKRGIKFIFASSCSVYGVGSEESLDEKSSVNPQTPYSLNKLQIEQDLATISDHNFSPICLRFATAFGLSPRMRFDIVINMLVGMAVSSKKIILNSDGKSWRPHVHVRDIIQSILCAIRFDYHEPEPLILNVGENKNNLQIGKVAEIVKEAVPGCVIQYLCDLKKTGKENRETELVQDRKIQDGVDKRTYKVVFDQIKTIFKGFECEWTVQRGIEEMVSRFQDLRLSPEQFKSRSFYRLQAIEQLFQEKRIDASLFWQ